jgi:ammonia channel protein AmtB
LKEAQTESPFFYFHNLTGYGFNPGSALLLQNASSTGAVAALAAANTSLSAAGGVISSLFANLYYQERKTGENNFDLTCAMNGMLSGLVSITAGCAVLEYWAALVTGLIAGLVYLMGSKVLIKYRIDDACDAIPVHLFNGLWGLITVGFLASPGRILTAYGPDSPVSQHAGVFYGGGGALFGCQVVALLFIVGWAVATMAPFFFWLHYFGWLRVDSLEERVGLDRSYHGEQRKADTEDDFLSRLDLQAYRRERKLRRQQRMAGMTPEEASVMSWNELSHAEANPPRKSSEHSAQVTRHSTAEIDDVEDSGME